MGGKENRLWVIMVKCNDFFKFLEYYLNHPFKVFKQSKDASLG